jgi:hypothetical protein
MPHPGLDQSTLGTQLRPMRHDLSDSKQCDTNQRTEDSPYFSGEDMICCVSPYMVILCIQCVFCSFHPFQQSPSSWCLSALLYFPALVAHPPGRFPVLLAAFPCIGQCSSTSANVPVAPPVPPESWTITLSISCFPLVASLSSTPLSIYCMYLEPLH